MAPYFVEAVLADRGSRALFLRDVRGCLEVRSVSMHRGLVAGLLG